MNIDWPQLINWVVNALISTFFGVISAYIILQLNLRKEREQAARKKAEDLRKELYGGYNLPPADIGSAVERAKRYIRENPSFLKLAIFIGTTTFVVLNGYQVVSNLAKATPTPTDTSTPLTTTTSTPTPESPTATPVEPSNWPEQLGVLSFLSSNNVVLSFNVYDQQTGALVGYTGYTTTSIWLVVGTYKVVISDPYPYIGITYENVEIRAGEETILQLPSP